MDPLLAAMVPNVADYLVPLGSVKKPVMKLIPSKIFEKNQV